MENNLLFRFTALIPFFTVSGFCRMPDSNAFAMAAPRKFTPWPIGYDGGQRHKCPIKEGT